ncbi:hypothetical protein CPT_Phriendly_016 [Vibrio phage Phriendly]|nr:hypothetical protein CPT_Phriendly_016 [Vibrio phage Phriendly]
MKNFHDNAHANNRLSRCYVAIFNEKRNSYDIKRIDSATKRTIYCRDGTEYPLQSDIVRIVFESLGYVNTKHQSMFVSRTPKRMWKAGLVPENLQSNFLYPRFVRAEDHMEVHDILDYIVNNKYPSFRKACLEVQARRAAVRAFHPNFAVSLSDDTDQLVMYYKNFEVGYVDVKDNKIYIGDTFTHLNEQIFEATGMQGVS